MLLFSRPPIYVFLQKNAAVIMFGVLGIFDGALGLLLFVSFFGYKEKFRVRYVELGETASLGQIVTSPGFWKWDWVFARGVLIWFAVLLFLQLVIVSIIVAVKRRIRKIDAEHTTLQKQSQIMWNAGYASGRASAFSDGSPPASSAFESSASDY